MSMLSDSEKLAEEWDKTQTSTLSEFSIKLIMLDRVDEAQEILLAESIEDDLLQRISETSVLDYLMKLEKFFDNRDLYLYKGWEDAQILSQPKVEKFWVSLDLRVSPSTELIGAMRCCSDEEAQNTVKYKKMEDGTYFVRFKILRRILDQIEMDHKDRAEEIASKESEA
jgi:hypothetical protein